LGIAASIIVAYATAQLSPRAQREKIRAELQFEFSIETAIRQLLGTQGWELHSFEHIKRHIRLENDTRLRELLLRAGAIAFDGMDDNGRKVEKWGLLKLNEHRLAKKANMD